MGVNALAGRECEVGGIHHVCYSGRDALRQIGRILQLKDKENVALDGRIFPYIVHYLTTGDLIQPTHEGENYLTELLQQMAQLDLLGSLLAHQKEASTVAEGRVTPAKNNDFSTNSSPLRIRTKEDRWVRKIFSRFVSFSPKARKGRKISSVYRPPSIQNKGTTIVLIRTASSHSCSVRALGPPTALKTFLGEATTQEKQDSAQDTIAALEKHGFVVTVRSSSVDSLSGTSTTQWLLYRGKRPPSRADTPLINPSSTPKKMLFSAFVNSCKRMSPKQRMEQPLTSKQQNQFYDNQEISSFKEQKNDIKSIRSGSLSLPSRKSAKDKLSLPYHTKSYHSEVSQTPATLYLDRSVCKSTSNIPISIDKHSPPPSTASLGRRYFSNVSLNDRQTSPQRTSSSLWDVMCSKYSVKNVFNEIF